MTNLPKPGEVLHVDLRHKVCTTIDGTKPIKCVQWNIERGYKLAGIIEELRKIDADIISVQEIDIACERSGFKDTGLEIAEALGLNYVFLCEFEELHSPLRIPETQGGGVHGNAILSKFDMSDFKVIEHRHHPVDWEHPVHPKAKREPRHGRRVSLRATIHTPQGDLALYNCHLEVFCGMLARMQQYADIMRDSRQLGLPHQAVLGDLNTMANGVARLSPYYCCDKMRWLSLGISEGKYWADHVFAVKEEVSAAQHPTNTRPINTHLLSLGLPKDVCEDLVNPGFEDPFDPVDDFTLDHPNYVFFGYHLMCGKLDWVLLKQMEVVNKAIGNHDFALSDHKWLMVEVRLK